MAMSFTNLVVLAFLLILTMELFCLLYSQELSHANIFLVLTNFVIKIEFMKHHEIDGDGFFFSLITDQS